MIDVATLRERIPAEPLLQLPELPYVHRASGKVREIYEVGNELLIVATDRLSAFDVILPDGIPGKGSILTQMSLYWFGETTGIIRNHLVANHDARLREVLKGHEELIPRSMLVRRLQPLPVEAVVRGYLSGSGWKHYLAHGNLFGQLIPQGLSESAKLPVPLFTPTTKAAVGGHDVPLRLGEGEQLLGAERFTEIRDISLQLYALGLAAAKRAGLILADTKFEFGLDEAGQLYLIDEVLTPDSSRYWPFREYAPGQAQPAFDKQFVRDFLDELAWDKTPPGPLLSAKVIEGTQERYLAAYEKIVG